MKSRMYRLHEPGGGGEREDSLCQQKLGKTEVDGGAYVAACQQESADSFPLQAPCAAP